MRNPMTSFALILMFLTPAIADDLLFATVEQRGQHEDGVLHAVSCANLDTGASGVMEWIGSYHPGNIFQDWNREGRTHVYATSTEAPMGGVNFLMTFAAFEPGLIIDGTGRTGTMHNPAAQTYVAKGWKAAVSAYDPDGYIEVYINRDFRYRDYREEEGGRWIEWRIDPRPYLQEDEQWKTGRWCFVDPYERKILAMSGHSYGDKWILIDIDTRAEQVFDFPYADLRNTRTMDIDVDLEGGVSVLVAHDGNFGRMLCFNNHGSIDPRQWELVDTIQESGLFGCAGSGGRMFYVTQYREIVECTASPAGLQEVSRTPYDLPTFVQYNHPHVEYARGELYFATGPDGGALGLAMCVLAFNPVTKATRVVLDLRPGSVLNPDARPWAINAICVTEEP